MHFIPLFDIVHANARNMINIQGGKGFLLAQREKRRRGTMSSVDQIFKKKIGKKNNDLLKYQQRQQKEAVNIRRLTEKNEKISTSDSDTSDYGNITFG